MGGERRVRRPAATLLATLVIAALAVGAPARHAAADDGVEVQGTSTYTVDPTANVVRVDIEVQLRNTRRDQRSGNVITRYYLDSFEVPIPLGTANVVATGPGGQLPVRLSRVGDGDIDGVALDVARIDLARNLFSGESATVHLRFDIVGLPARSPDPTRVNPAYAAFSAWAFGDPGQATVRVIVPDGFEIDTVGADVAPVEAFGQQVYEASGITSPDEWYLFVSAREDDRLTSTPVTVDGAGFDVRAWPGDDQWQAFASQQVATGVPTLVDLVGLPWPIDEQVEVIEAYTPYLYGYAGWYSPEDDVIEIGEDLEPEVALHELSHAWFNDELFSDRWVNEGFAQAFASRALDATGGAGTAAAAVDPDAPGAVPLSIWNDYGSDEGEDYGYAASHFVIDALVDEVGADVARDVIAAADAREIAYLGDGEAEAVVGPAGWRRLLDLVDERAEAPTFDLLVHDLVASVPDRQAFDARANARAAYAELEAAGDDWAPPLGVRQAMSDWQFESATELITDATEALDRRADLVEVLDRLGVEPSAELEASYEEADEDLDDVLEELDRQLAAAARVGEARTAADASPGLLERVGLLGSDPDDTVDDAVASLADGDAAAATDQADQALDQLDGAASAGLTRLGLGVGGLALLGLVVALVIVLGRRRRRRASEQREPTEGDDPAEPADVAGESSSGSSPAPY